VWFPSNGNIALDAIAFAGGRMDETFVDSRLLLLWHVNTLRTSGVAGLTIVTKLKG
jgi:hypothetical protein